MVSIERFSLNDTKFIERVLSDKEIQLLKQRKSSRRKLEFIAGRFAAKEAFLKALGIGIGKITLKEVEVLADENSKPHINYLDYNVQVSITHTDRDACAFVVVEKKS